VLFVLANAFYHDGHTLNDISNIAWGRLPHRRRAANRAWSHDPGSVATVPGGLNRSPVGRCVVGEERPAPELVPTGEEFHVSAAAVRR
jgi:hypothetical protein